MGKVWLRYNIHLKDMTDIEVNKYIYDRIDDKDDFISMIRDKDRKEEYKKLRITILEELLRIFIKNNFPNDNEHILCFFNCWSLPLYDIHNTYALNKMPVVMRFTDDPNDDSFTAHLIPFRYPSNRCNFILRTLALIYTFHNDGKITLTIPSNLINGDRYKAYFHYVKPLSSIPLYDNIDEALAEYNNKKEYETIITEYRFDDNNKEIIKDYSKVVKAIRIVDNKITFYDDNGGIVNGN